MFFEFLKPNFGYTKSLEDVEKIIEEFELTSKADFQTYSGKVQFGSTGE
jgi:hypothetical protein